MDMKKNLAKIGYANLISSVLGTLVLSLFLIFPELALGQKPVGVVTALKGSAQLTRAKTQTALAFKDAARRRCCRSRTPDGRNRPQPLEPAPSISHHVQWIDIGPWVFDEIIPLIRHGFGGSVHAFRHRLALLV